MRKSQSLLPDMPIATVYIDDAPVKRKLSNGGWCARIPIEFSVSDDTNYGRDFLQAFITVLEKEILDKTRKKKGTRP